MNLPPRYHTQWRVPFLARVEEVLRPGLTILDVGAGAAPTLPLDARPPDTTYVGLDISSTELERAPAGSYSRMLEHDVARFNPELEGQFDLVLSWQVFEHVRPLAGAVENCRRYLKAGGLLAAQMSGTFTLPSVLNSLVPRALSRALLHRLNGRPYESIFDAHYDRCWYSALELVFAEWSKVEIRPLYHGAEYFRFSQSLQRAYLAYEEQIARRNIVNLATHYLVAAER